MGSESARSIPEPSGPAVAARPQEEKEGNYAIIFDDADMEMEVFSGHGAMDAALNRYEQVSISWNCHLMREMFKTPRLATAPQEAAPKDVRDLAMPSECLRDLHRWIEAHLPQSGEGMRKFDALLAWLEVTLAPQAPREAQRQAEIHAHDCPQFKAFFDKHALGDKLIPSCFTCGQQRQPEEWAVTHAELPNIYVCSTCRDKIARPAPEGWVGVSREQLAEWAGALEQRMKVWPSAGIYEQDYVLNDIRKLLPATPEPRE